MRQRWNEHYTKKAKKEWYLARSAYKLMEMDEKYWLVSWSNFILDIWCAPWSWLQYISKRVWWHNNMSQDSYKWDSSHDTTYWLSEKKIIWFDLKKVDSTFHWVETYVQDITDQKNVSHILESHDITYFDLIVSDMAPDTIGMSDIDAIRCIWLIEKTLWLFDTYLKQEWKFVIKIFMWPWYDEFVNELKWKYWKSNIVTYKPKACRPKSKEIYIVKRF